MKKLEIGDDVEVSHKIGRNNAPQIVTGKIKKFSTMIKINGEDTAAVEFYDKTYYYFPISKIKLLP